MKNIFFVLAFMLIGSLNFASTNLVSNLDVSSESATELSIINIEKTVSLNENLIIKKQTIDLGFFGCESTVVVIDKKTGKRLAQFKYYDEGCKYSTQLEYWYV